MKKTFLALLMVAGMVATAQTVTDRLLIATEAVAFQTAEKDGYTVTLATYEFSESTMRTVINFEIEKMGGKVLQAWQLKDGKQSVYFALDGEEYYVVLIVADKWIGISY